MKVILADQEPNIRYGLMVLLGEQSDLEIVGDADNSADLILQIQKECPDLVLLGWGLPGLPIDGLLVAIRSIRPEIRVIILSEKAYLRESAVKAGADAFMCKADPPAKLLTLMDDIRGSITPEIICPSDIEIQ